MGRLIQKRYLPYEGSLYSHVTSQRRPVLAIVKNMYYRNIVGYRKRARFVPAMAQLWCSCCNYYAVPSEEAHQMNETSPSLLHSRHDVTINPRCCTILNLCTIKNTYKFTLFQHPMSELSDENSDQFERFFCIFF